MKPAHSIAALLTILMLALPVHAFATPPRPGAYASGFIGASVPVDHDAQTFNFDNGNVFNDRVQFDPGINVGGTLGYDFGYIRTEGEISYKRSDIKSVTEKPANFSFLNVDGNLDSFSMMFNAFIDFHNTSKVTPYLGGGIGFSSLHLSDTFGVDTRGGTVQQVPLYFSDTDAVFAYQGGGGFEVAINRQFSLDLGYRYFGTDTARFGTGGPQTTSMKFSSHNGVVGFRVRF